MNDNKWKVASAKGNVYEIDITEKQVDEIDFEKLKAIKSVNGWFWVNVQFKDGDARLQRVDDLWKENPPEVPVE